MFYSRRGGGTGLGLPIARQIIERHGGAIEVDSVVGRGTTFRIRLPRRHRTTAAYLAEDPLRYLRPDEILRPHFKRRSGVLCGLPPPRPCPQTPRRKRPGL